MTVLAAGALAFAGCMSSAGLPRPLADAPLDPAVEQAARETYNRGVAAAAERRDELAYAAFDSVVKRFPGSRYSTVSLRERGLAGYRLGRYAQAAADLRRLLEHTSDYETTDSAVVLASALQRGGEPEAALAALVRYVPERDADVQGARIVGEAAVRSLKLGTASRLAAELPERAFLAPLYARAADEVRAGDPERAAALSRTAERLAGAQGGRERQRGARDGAPPAAGGSALVGAVLPQGGPLGAVAQDVQDGARLALAEIAVAGGPTYLLEVMPEGDGGVTGASLDALADRGARVVIGPLESETARAAVPVALERGLLVVSPTATDSTLLSAAPALVTLNATSGELGEAMGRFAAGDLGILRAAVIGSDDEYGRANARGFRRAFEQGGGEIVAEHFYPRGTANFGAALRGARLKGAQALFLPSRSADQVLTVLSQVEYYSGGSFQMLGTEVWRDETFLQRAGRFAEEGYFADTFSPDARVTRYWDFRAQYYKRYGRPLPNHFPGWGYDAVNLALRYLSRSGAGIEETMYLGATATYSVRQGSVRKVPVISRIEGGTPLLTRIEDRAR